MTDARFSVIFFGTPAFALPAPEALVKNNYRIDAVITRPDERAGRKQILTSPPVKIWARERGIPVFQPEILDPEHFAREVPAADIFIVAAYGKIIPKSILELPRFGVINIHPSLLPRWRGPSPIQYAILSGDSDTGVSLMQMDELMDHGPIIAARRAACDMRKETYLSLHDKLAKIGAELLTETLPRWIRGAVEPTPQKSAEATFSKIISKDDGRIDWKKSADEIERMTRALTPWPGAWTLWPTDKKILRVRIVRADVIRQKSPTGGPGYVWSTKENPMCVSTGRESLAVQSLGIEGKNATDSASFLRGRPRIIGNSFV